MPFRILLVEDDPADAFLAEDALARESGAAVEHASAGGAALGMIERDGFDLVLLDQNLPGIKGDEVVRHLRSKDGEPRDLTPVVMFSTSAASHEVREAYRAGANAFVQKPSDLEGYEQVARSLDQFWNRTAIRPQED